MSNQKHTPEASASSDSLGEGTSQGQLAKTASLTALVDTFPQDPLVYAFGYGSGVFSQTLKGGPQHEGMIDMILVVDDHSTDDTSSDTAATTNDDATTRFYQQNIQGYPHHYPWSLRSLQRVHPSFLGKLQRNFILPDARVLFHVVDDPLPMKYGVVHAQDLIRDLTQWETLYLAGRLHKPTLEIPLSKHQRQSQDAPMLTCQFSREALLKAQSINLKAAVAASLLLQPVPDHESDTVQHIVWEDFYSKIAGLSYTGDFRMQVGGEDPLKIRKLVEAPGQLDRFHGLYRSNTLQGLQDQGIISCRENGNDQGIEWSPRSETGRLELMRALPPRLQSSLESTSSSSSSESTIQVVPSIASIQSQQKILASVLAGIVAPAARHQSLKGIFTLGFRRSLQYAGAKLSKGLFRKKG